MGKYRFNISLNEAVSNVDWACQNSLGGEIIVPKTSSYRLTDLAKAINPKNKLKVVEDCAQSHGAKYKDQKVGSFGDFGHIHNFGDQLRWSW